MGSLNTAILRLLFALMLESTLAEAGGQFPKSLAGVSPPRVKGLLGGQEPIVVDRQWATVLGKALFWDTAAGSDGIACGSCHFHAGADARIRNQNNPGQYHDNVPEGQTFETTATGQASGPDYSMRAADFPFFQLEDPADKTSIVRFSTDDVMGSAGSFKQDFLGLPIVPESSRDDCRPTADGPFHSQGKSFRQTTDRNTPTVINAVFNHRNFWDGRANNIFNGESPWGVRDPQAGVWVATRKGLIKRRLALPNAALASQAVSPLTNAVEMSCSGRRLQDVARKLLHRRALEAQAVHPEDSVLGMHVDNSGKGLRLSYADLIRRSFAPRYWKSMQTTPEGLPLLEANFPMFFGLAIQMYESTLISDHSPYDTPKGSDGLPKGLDEAQKRGLNLFMTAQCSKCHGGPTFSFAAVPEIYAHRNPNGPLLVNRMVINGAVPGEPLDVSKGVTYALFDQGYANTSVTPAEQDPGQGGRDPFGHPLSFTEQYVNALLKDEAGLVDPFKVYSCDFQTPFTQDYSPAELKEDPNARSKRKCRRGKEQARLPNPSVFAREKLEPGMGRAFRAFEGAFKIPSLRNVELTGPYMHNGGMKSLEEVLEFYSRGGNVNNTAHFAVLVFQQDFTAQQRADIVAFLKSLTDERVRWERAPFDHPALSVPEGSADGATEPGRALARDRTLEIPAIGRHGRSVAQGPLQGFADLLPP